MELERETFSTTAICVLQICWKGRHGITTTLQSLLQINHFEIILGINKPQQQFLLQLNHLEIFLYIYK